MSVSEASALLRVRGLSVEYGGRRGAFKAVDDVSFDIGEGETLALVGESGSGKSTIGRAILGLTPVSSGSISFHDEELTHLSGRARQRAGRRLQVVFQDPYSSLNVARTVGDTLADSVRGSRLSRQEVGVAVTDMLRRVGLPGDAASRYPKDFSGGQRQRVAIARALISRPRLVICDEAVSALDLSVQAQILNLLRELQQELGLSYLFISHDLKVVQHVSQRVIVLRRGRIVESGDVDAVYANPVDPYTRLLLESAPVPDPVAARQRFALSGTPDQTRGAAR